MAATCGQPSTRRVSSRSQSSVKYGLHALCDAPAQRVLCRHSRGAMPCGPAHRGPSTCIEDSSLAYGSHEWSSDAVPRFLWSPARLSAGSVHCARMCSTLAECPHSDASTPRQGLTVCGGTRWGTYASAYVPAHGSSCRSRFCRGAAGRCSWVDTRHHRWDSADERRNWHARDAEALSMMTTGVREINLADLHSMPAWRL